MAQTETRSTFTAGVFADAAAAARGIDALRRQGFPPEALSLIAKVGAEAEALAAQVFGQQVGTRELPAVGEVLATGSLVGALDGPDKDLGQIGIAVAMTRAGFQSHDGRIFETLTGRGGVLVAVRSEPRAADALATLHNYGGGNAAIGAWSGRL